jgi:hypothetical protein
MIEVIVVGCLAKRDTEAHGIFNLADYLSAPIPIIVWLLTLIRVSVYYFKRISPVVLP